MPHVGVADDGDGVEAGGEAAADEKVTSADEVPAGEYVRYVDAPKGQFFNVGKTPQYEARGFLWGLRSSCSLDRHLPLPPPPPPQRSGGLSCRCGAWGMT